MAKVAQKGVSLTGLSANAVGKTVGKARCSRVWSHGKASLTVLDLADSVRLTASARLQERDHTTCRTTPSHCQRRTQSQPRPSRTISACDSSSCCSAVHAFPVAQQIPVLTSPICRPHSRREPAKEWHDFHIVHVQVVGKRNSFLLCQSPFSAYTTHLVVVVVVVAVVAASSPPPQWLLTRTAAPTMGWSWSESPCVTQCFC